MSWCTQWQAVAQVVQLLWWSKMPTLGWQQCACQYHITKAQWACHARYVKSKILPMFDTWWAIVMHKPSGLDRDTSKSLKGFKPYPAKAPWAWWSRHAGFSTKKAKKACWLQPQHPFMWKLQYTYHEAVTKLTLQQSRYKSNQKPWGLITANQELWLDSEISQAQRLDTCTNCQKPRGLMHVQA